MHLTSLVALFVLGAGCGREQDPQPCDGHGFFGDPDLPTEIEPILIQPDGSYLPLEDADTIVLHTPLQGGKVILAGALVTNVCLNESGQITIGARLFAPGDEGDSYNAEADVRYEEMGERPGWAVPRFVNDERNMAPNLESCGFVPRPRDTDGCEWILEVRAFDRRSERNLASERIEIVPICPEDDPGDSDVSPELELEQCQCQCAAFYEAGRCDKEDLPSWTDPAQACE